jgi:CRISPR-associated protein Csm2
MNRQQRQKPTDKSQPAQHPEKIEITDSDYRAIIIEGDGKMLNKKARDCGKYLCSGKKTEKLSSSQIRNVLDEIQRMKDFGDGKRLQLLRPKLAYAAGRHKGKVMALQEITDKAIELVNNEEQFENFRHFFEAIVAYHRYHGGE